jgi:hypothetical protein
MRSTGKLAAAGTNTNVSASAPQTAAALISVSDVLPSQPSGPGLMGGVVLILMARLAGDLPAMILCRHRIGKCQSQGIGKIG